MFVGSLSTKAPGPRGKPITPVVRNNGEKSEIKRLMDRSRVRCLAPTLASAGEEHVISLGFWIGEPPHVDIATISISVGEGNERPPDRLSAQVASSEALSEVRSPNTRRIAIVRVDRSPDRIEYDVEFSLLDRLIARPIEDLILISLPRAGTLALAFALDVGAHASPSLGSIGMVTAATVDIAYTP